MNLLGLRRSRDIQIVANIAQNGPGI